MSWAEIKKSVNSRLDIPLNHLIWLNDYKTYGQDSYVYHNKDILHELYEDYALSMNDISIQTEAFIYITDKNIEIGKALSCIYGIDDSVDWTSIRTISDLQNNSTAYDIVITNYSWAVLPIVINDLSSYTNNQSIMQALANSKDYVKKIISSSALLDTIYQTPYVDLIANNAYLPELCSNIVSTGGSRTGYAFVTTMVSNVATGTYSTPSGTGSSYGKSGSSYVNMSGSSITNNKAVNRDNSTQSSSTYTLNKIVKSFSSESAAYYSGGSVGPGVDNRTTGYVSPTINYCLLPLSS